MSLSLISTRGFLLCLAPGAPPSGDTYFYALRRQIPLRNSSCDLQERIDATCEHEQEDLQFEAACRNRVNRLWKESLQQAESRFDPLSVDLLKVFDVGRHRSR